MLLQRAHRTAGAQLCTCEAHAALEGHACAGRRLHCLSQHCTVDSDALGDAEPDVCARLRLAARLAAVRGAGARNLNGGDGPAAAPRPQPAHARWRPRHAPGEPTTALLARQLSWRHVEMCAHLSIYNRARRGTLLLQPIRGALLPGHVQPCADGWLGACTRTGARALQSACGGVVRVGGLRGPARLFPELRGTRGGALCARTREEPRAHHSVAGRFTRGPGSRREPHTRATHATLDCSLHSLMGYDRGGAILLVCHPSALQATTDAHVAALLYVHSPLPNWDGRRAVLLLCGLACSFPCAHCG